MSGDWVVQLDDGTHAIHADITFASKLKITWDGVVLESSHLWSLKGDLMSFQRNSHSYLLSVRGFGMLRRLVLSMDGVEVSRGGVAAPIKGLSVEAPRGGVAALVKRAWAPVPIHFIKELSVVESEEVVGTEEYPLDNCFGDQTFSTVHQVSRESANELSLDTSNHLGGKLGLDVLSAIKAEIEAQISQQAGQKIGEKVTESRTLNFSVGPKSSVLYQVVWKRKVRSGERVYMSDGNPVTVPYRVNYGLSCEVRTQALTANH